MKNQFEELLEAEVVESFRLTEDLANDLSRESTDNLTPIFTIISIITSATEC
jgi:hypothetical protein